MSFQLSGQAPRRRILLVDDIELNRIMTEAVLSGSLYDVESVSDGAAALRAVEERAYDLVLMDLDMPGLDGHEAAAAIRDRAQASPSMARPRIVALSASHGEKERVRAQASGMDSHIGRPITPAALLVAVEKAITDVPVEMCPVVWCRATYDEMVKRLGSARMHTVLIGLRAQCEAMDSTLRALPCLTEDVARQAHDLVSVAGMLGFERLSRQCFGIQTLSLTPIPARSRVDLERALAATTASIDDHLARAGNGPAA